MDWKEEFENTEIAVLFEQYEDLIEKSGELAEDYLEHVHFEKSHPMSDLASELLYYDKVKNGKGQLKAFIESLLEAQKAELLEEIKKMKPGYRGLQYRYGMEALDSVIHLLEEKV